MKNILNGKAKFAARDLEYPNLSLIICRRGIIKPAENENEGGKLQEVLAYIDGTEADAPMITLRLNNLK